MISRGDDFTLFVCNDEERGMENGLTTADARATEHKKRGANEGVEGLGGRGVEKGGGRGGGKWGRSGGGS